MDLVFKFSFFKQGSNPYSDCYMLVCLSAGRPCNVEGFKGLRIRQ